MQQQMNSNQPKDDKIVNGQDANKETNAPDNEQSESIKKGDTLKNNEGEAGDGNSNEEDTKDIPGKKDEAPL